MYCKIILCGRLTKDPELRYSAEGKAYGSFTIAVDRRNYGSEKKTDFFNVTVFGKTAENCANFLAKGKLALVDGAAVIDPYQDKEGNKKQSFKVLANEVKFLSPKDSGGQKDDFIAGEVEHDDGELPF